MVRVRQNLEKQADLLIQRFEEKLKKQEERAKKVKQDRDNFHQELVALSSRRYERQQRSHMRSIQAKDQIHRTSMESFRSSLSELSERSVSSLMTNRLGSKEKKGSLEIRERLQIIDGKVSFGPSNKGTNRQRLRVDREQSREL
jgi:hypothetical protein